MAMLAEARSKQKWSEDPRNTKWSSDKERYGYQMLEKMGWADGKGLGKHKSGSTSHVKIKKRKQNLGLGAKESHDNDWIAQQADFNNLLSALQEHSGNAELQSEEQNKKAMLEVAKASRKRVFYKRFIRSKDTSQYSQKDMACIFGNVPCQSALTTPLDESESDDEVASKDSTASCPTIPCDSTSGFVTYTSKQSIQEYFACRMKELRDGKGIERSSGGDKGVNGEKPGDVESEDRIERRDGKGIERSNEGDMGVNVEKRKVASGEMNEKWTKKGRKKSKRSNEEGIGELGNEKKLNDKEVLTKSSKVKTKKSRKRRTKDDSETIANGMESITEEIEKCDEDTSRGGDKVKTKKCKKRRTKDDSETIANGMESISEEIEKCDEDASRGGGKVKTKKSRKRTKNDVLDTKDKDVSDTVENGLDSVPEQNVENISASKEGKVKRKKSKKGKRNIAAEGGSDMMVNDDTGKVENNLGEEEQAFKQDKNKKKKRKKSIKKDE